jgi:hypothetical protein
MKNRQIDPFPPPAETLKRKDRETVMTQMDKEFVNNSDEPVQKVSQKLKYLRAENQHRPK